MAAHCILRVEKHKTPGTLGSSLQHALRERETPNADPARRKLNANGGAKSSAAGIAKMRELFDALECKPRHRSGKNAPVLAIEYFVGMSPDAAIASDRTAALAYLNDALKWVVKKHGKHNVLAVQYHFDEKTPHASVFVFPELAGKLNAKAFLGGRKVLADMQTAFAADVGSKHGLERGVERSRASHVDVADWYATVKERDQLRTEVQELQHQVVELKGEVSTLNGKIDHLVRIVEAMEPVVREETEIRIGEALERTEATQASTTQKKSLQSRFSGASGLSPAIKRHPKP